MTDILPEPAESTPIVSTIAPEETSRRQPRQPKVRRTASILVGLIVIAALCLVAGYTYDVIHNHDQDNTRKQDLAYISNVLSGYHNLYHYYPTLSQFNSSTFSALAPSLNRSKFKDPSSNVSQLSATPQANSYAYQPTPLNCDNVTTICSGYSLTAILSNNKDYIVTNRQN